MTKYSVFSIFQTLKHPVCWAVTANLSTGCFKFSKINIFLAITLEHPVFLTVCCLGRWKKWNGKKFPLTKIKFLWDSQTKKSDVISRYRCGCSCSACLVLKKWTNIKQLKLNDGIEYNNWCVHNNFKLCLSKFS